MVIDVDTLDFVNEDADRMQVIHMIESRLYGLFPE